MITFFEPIGDTSLRVLARQCRRQQFAEVTRERPVETAPPATAAGAPPFSSAVLHEPAKRQRSGDTTSDGDISYDHFTDDIRDDDLDAFDFGDVFDLFELAAEVGENGGG